MNNFAKKVKHFLVSEDGPTAVEYAIMVTLIALVCIAGATTLGVNANAKLAAAAATLGGS